MGYVVTTLTVDMWAVWHGNNGDIVWGDRVADILVESNSQVLVNMVIHENIEDCTLYLVWWEEFKSW